MQLSAFLATTLVVGLSLTHAAPGEAPKQLVVLMLDGFRWDYLNLVPNERLGGFGRFVHEGVRAKWVNGIFPTLSYPSWTTLSTGLYPENHGILGNYFYSREHDKKFVLEDKNDDLFWWSKAEPIWTTATKKGLRVATVLWSRSDVPFEDVLPESANGYVVRKGLDAIERTLNKVVSHLKDGMQLVMAYGEHIDNIGHARGPTSSDIPPAIIGVGEKLDNFFRQLEEADLLDKVNVLIVSDHGMTNHVKFVDVWEGVPQDDILYTMDQGAIVAVYMKEGRSPDQVYEALRADSRGGGVHVFLKSNIPAYFNYSGSADCPDILITAEQGVTLRGSKEYTQVPAAWGDTTMRGLHGYVPETPDMRTVFMGTGPDLKGEGVIIPPVQLVDIYQVYCSLLNLEPQPNNGSWDRVRGMLARGDDIGSNSGPSGTVTSLPAIIALVITAVYRAF